MSWADVFAAIVFKSHSDAWGAGAVSPVSDEDEASILSILEILYNGSSTARALLDQAAALGPIRFATTPYGNPGLQGIAQSDGLKFIAVNLATIDTMRYFNDKGTWVPEIRALTIIHEIAHFVRSPAEDDPTYNESLMNGANFDFMGPIVRLQNNVAREMGYDTNIQVAYDIAIIFNDGRYPQLINVNYTDGHEIDVARFGDYDEIDGLGPSDDNIDHTSRNSDVRDLIFGFGGADTIRAGKGNDFVYGGDGDDIIEGGAVMIISLVSLATTDFVAAPVMITSGESIKGSSQIRPARWI